MNPLTNLLQSLPARVRLAIYAAAFLATLIWAAWQAADGDWATFIGALIGALVSALAGSNVPKRPRS
ncbi:hypothetical protein [Nocardioides panaciterrulae]|uniref:Putative membrane protein YeaQ/YmgE (Transglycosylase-associated protein family) n=1 Tax=Nocardioides panaciterrulae TaxID=661492 RepID=A0A7Y9EA53_9ACTN|nr:hypothetical protein [Nocardioides panaciterrulae]NYD43922.1 putative membrane protein YeaQ/YmgE (transglycosylase-associated protein family) [Nocardioides panaciterrulae]NYD43991.1 putative membrane protein YeaQ/YmgE (transglycosylase-associated protein family) [Nocardioides panaciterrulae]